jgi:hypothetical protein
VERAYREAVDSIGKELVLPYEPTLYIIPFVVQKKIPSLTPGKSYLRTNLAFTFFDVDDFAKLGIYIPVTMLTLFSDYISGQICHELAHVIREAQTRIVGKKDIALILSDPVGADQNKEKRKDETIERFPKTLRDQTGEWDRLSKEPQTISRVRKEAWIAEWDIFESVVFGDRQEELNKLIVSAIPPDLLKDG